ncbi:serine hydrolase [Neolewinella xylanilytica]|uniref:serine hydrolase n=1 Tax=Neolewinella xylanilytica TaxID=1514080 RepID=UPI001FE8A01C|nr:serine hydrolase [Neolewinella xylanilytica]
MRANLQLLHPMRQICCLHTILFLLLLVAPLGRQVTAQPNELERIIEDNRDSLSRWIDGVDSFEIQVLYTRIDRSGDSVRLTTHRWGADSTQYFYPASTVKMPVAALALQRLHELGVLGLEEGTPMFHGKGLSSRAPAQTAVSSDTSSVTGLPSVSQYVRKIFLVSDNDAYNRLFEWLGPTYLNDALHRVGITGGRILHRVGVAGFDDTTHAYLNPVKFADGYETLYQTGERHDPYYDPLPRVQDQERGVGYTRNDTLIDGAFDFTHKNYLSLRNLHDILVRIVVPEAVGADTFRLDSAAYALLREAMSQRPRESISPRYTEPDNYVKFWIYGDRPDEFRIPDDVRILNKVGWAYGYLTDVAYVTDGDVEFILAGTIHTNANRIFNDGAYEYEEDGMPFFGRLGRAVLDYERAQR